MNLDEAHAVYYAFLLGLCVRVGIEYLNIEFPLGQDTLSYSIGLLKYEQGLKWDLLYFGPPLPYLMGYVAMLLTGLDEVMVWKFVSPIINSVVVGALTFMVVKAFKWSWHKALFLSVVFSFYPVEIIFSNGLYSQHLATAFFFLAITYYVLERPINAAVFSLLVALSHPLISTLLCGFLALEWLRKRYKKEQRRLELPLIAILAIVTVLITFLLPALGSSNPMAEATDHISSYLVGNAFGIRENTADIMVAHFMCYCGSLVPCVGIGAFAMAPQLLSMLFFTLLMSFIPVGWLWMRWQWVSTIPLLIVAVDGLYHDDWFKPLRWLKFLVLAVIVLNGILYATNTEVINRTTIQFADLGEVAKSCDYIAHIVGDKVFLFISSYENFRVYEYNLAKGGANGVFVRDNMVVNRNGTIYLSYPAVRGSDFYALRHTTIDVDAKEAFDLVILVRDKYSATYGHSDSYYRLFTKVKTIGGTEIYVL